MVECYQTELRKGKNIPRKKMTTENEEIRLRLLFFCKRGEDALIVTSVIKHFSTSWLEFK